MGVHRLDSPRSDTVLYVTLVLVLYDYTRIILRTCAPPARWAHAAMVGRNHTREHYIVTLYMIIIALCMIIITLCILLSHFLRLSPNHALICTQRGQIMMARNGSPRWLYDTAPLALYHTAKS